MTAATDTKPPFVLIDAVTGEKIEVGSQHRTIRRADHDCFGNRSSAFITGFDPPSPQRVQGCVHYRRDALGVEATANPSFFEAIIIKNDPEKIRNVIEAREWEAFWQIIDPSAPVIAARAQRAIIRSNNDP